ncbi:hypothetical protein LJC59_09805 [Desulfovibrio sp. OttesenSCG-928-A18]|nr:hypothetical protein [Desulfovibrio sp. OttesenSCG-928-A18]
MTQIRHSPFHFCRKDSSPRRSLRRPCGRAPGPLVWLALLALFTAALTAAFPALGAVSRPLHTEQERARAQVTPIPPQTAQQGESFSGRRAFRGMVRRDMAEQAARVAASIAAYEQAARILAKEPDLRFLTLPPEQGARSVQVPDADGAAPDQNADGPGRVNPAEGRARSTLPQLSSGAGYGSLPVARPGEVPGGLPGPLSLDGMALMLFRTEDAAIGVEGFPPDVQAVVYLRLIPPDNLRASLRQVLLRPDLLELHGQVMAGQRFLLMRYDSIASELLPLAPGRTAGGKETLAHLQGVINEMLAMDIYARFLASYDDRWQHPQESLTRLRKANSLAPMNPLVLTALAEVQLQLDRPVQAMDHIGQAIAIAPDIARAHDVKGAVLLRQRLPALAAKAFGEAITLSPRNPAYHLHRGAAHLVLEEEELMCADFAAACALGECEEMQWAREQGRCSGLLRQGGPGQKAAPPGEDARVPGAGQGQGQDPDKTAPGHIQPEDKKPEAPLEQAPEPPDDDDDDDRSLDNQALMLPPANSSPGYGAKT